MFVSLQNTTANPHNGTTMEPPAIRAEGGEEKSGDERRRIGDLAKDAGSKKTALLWRWGVYFDVPEMRERKTKNAGSAKDERAGTSLERSRRKLEEVKVVYKTDSYAGG